MYYFYSRLIFTILSNFFIRCITVHIMTSNDVNKCTLADVGSVCKFISY